MINLKKKERYENMRIKTTLRVTNVSKINVASNNVGAMLTKHYFSGGGGESGFCTYGMNVIENKEKFKKSRRTSAVPVHVADPDLHSMKPHGFGCESDIGMRIQTHLLNLCYDGRSIN